MQQNKTWIADLYLRLSREDGDKDTAGKPDSNSIVNQRELALAFLESHPDITLHEIRVDDGYTGSSFDRPAFSAMLDDVRAGVVNCVIVKDLSRFGRDYIAAGDYIEKIFPTLGVRFIAINDGYDSVNERTQSDAILIPFKNLINDAYCRDTSLKIRALFDMKRSRGEYIGAFAGYGYQKDPQNKNKLIVDEPAAAVVREIFRLKLSGMSQDGIAKHLNTLGILCPTEYKKARGEHFFNGLAKKAVAEWSPASVRRLLVSELYIGHMAQGKSSTPSHKVKERKPVPKEQWVVVENTHPAIISEADFETVQRVLSLETRTAPGRDVVYPFSGLLFCGVCGEKLVRKMVPSGGGKLPYYICNRKKKTGDCASHSISATRVDESIFAAIAAQITAFTELKYLLEALDEPAYITARLQGLEESVQQKVAQIAQWQQYKRTLYESLMRGVIEQADFDAFGADYDEKIAAADAQCAALREQMEQLKQPGGSDRGAWVRELAVCGEMQSFGRDVVVSLIDRVTVGEDGTLEIQFRFADQLMELAATDWKVNQPAIDKGKEQAVSGVA